MGSSGRVGAFTEQGSSGRCLTQGRQWPHYLLTAMPRSFDSLSGAILTMAACSRAEQTATYNRHDFGSATFAAQHDHEQR